MAVALGGPAHAMSATDQRQASQLFQKHDWQGLATLAGRAASEDPGDGFAWYYAGLADDGLGRRDDAIAAYEKALPTITPYLRDSVAQLLAEDDAAQHHTDKLVALYRQYAKSDPMLARSLETQFPAVLADHSLPAIPSAIPAFAAQALGKARQWQPDAALVSIDASEPAHGQASTIFRFYSAKTRLGWSLTLSGGTWTPLLVGPAPQWRAMPLPANFLDLPAALAVARQGGLHDAVFDALLAYWSKLGRPGRFAWLVRPSTFDPDHPVYLVAADGAPSLLNPAQYLESAGDNAEMNRIIAAERARNDARRHVSINTGDIGLQYWVACATGIGTLGHLTFMGWQTYRGLLIPAPGHTMFVPLVRPYFTFNAPPLKPNPSVLAVHRPYLITDPPHAVYFYDRDEWSPQAAGKDIAYLEQAYTQSTLGRPCN